MSTRPPDKRRVDMRKNRSKRSRANDLTKQVLEESDRIDRLARSERVSGRSEQSRRRTVVDVDGAGRTAGDQAAWLRGRVAVTIGPTQCEVLAEDGRLWKAVIRRLLRTLSVDGRHAVVAGDAVRFSPIGADQAVIEAIEPRISVLSRTHQYREHIIAANVDQAVIVMAAAEPPLKPALLDRYLVSAGRGRVRPVLCINKLDLVDAVELQPLVGGYARLGIDVVLASVADGRGIPTLRRLLAGRQTVFTGQSGVGKSSLLNAIEPGWKLRVGTVSDVSQKGRHTTRFARLLGLSTGGSVVDTPGVRQLELWDVLPDELEGYFPEFRPFVARCRFPNCSHRQEHECAVRGAVEAGLISNRRYLSYLRMRSPDDDRRG